MCFKKKQNVLKEAVGIFVMPRGCTDARCVAAAATGVERCGRVVATGTGGGAGAGGRPATSGTKVRSKP